MMRTGFLRHIGGLVVVMLLAGFQCAGQEMQLDVSEWERGVELRSSTQKDMAMFLWFYEHNLFDAVSKGINSRGSWDFARTVDPEHRHAVLRASAMELVVNSTSDGARLSLTVTNHSDHDWPEMAGIIPCFNPGLREDTKVKLPKNPQLADAEQDKTYFLGPDGLSLLTSRAIHFNHRLRSMIDQRSDSGKFPFSFKWPTSSLDAGAGLLIRESQDGKWVAGIAWEDFISAQGHNPRKCMHVCVRVGPLERGKTKIVNGKMYLFQGTKEDCLIRIRRDLGIE